MLDRKHAVQPLLINLAAMHPDDMLALTRRNGGRRKQRMHRSPRGTHQALALGDRQIACQQRKRRRHQRFHQRTVLLPGPALIPMHDLAQARWPHLIALAQPGLHIGNRPLLVAVEHFQHHSALGTALGQAGDQPLLDQMMGQVVMHFADHQRTDRG
ncbi:hypothetical protein D9M71_656230 [compost metagenome]